jgi:membrane protease YdiL (CAAX protease family)
VTDQGPADGRAVRWGLGDVLVAAAAGIVLASLVGAIWVSASGAGPTDISTDMASLVGEWLGVVGVLALVSRSKGTGSLANDFGLRLVPRTDLALGVAVGVASQVVLSNVVTPIVSHFQHHLKLSEHAIDVGTRAASSSPAAKVLVAVVFVVGAPVVEELFFRGVLQRALVRRVGVVAGVAVGAVVFALLHLQGNVGFASAVTLVGELSAFGVVLALLAERTGRLGPGIVAHAAFNAVATYSLLHH